MRLMHSQRVQMNLNFSVGVKSTDRHVNGTSLDINVMRATEVITIICICCSYYNKRIHLCSSHTYMYVCTTLIDTLCKFVICFRIKFKQVRSNWAVSNGKKNVIQRKSIKTCKLNINYKMFCTILIVCIRNLKLTIELVKTSCVCTYIYGYII